MAPTTGPNGDGYPERAGYPTLPPGAYVNPAFFTRTNEATLQTPPPNLPPDVQQQMDILNHFRQHASG